MNRWLDEQTDGGCLAREIDLFFDIWVGVSVCGWMQTDEQIGGMYG